jgi:hypothetical protein
MSALGDMIIHFYKVKIVLSSLYILYIFPSTFSFTCGLWYVYIFRFFWRLPWLIPEREWIEIGFKPFSLVGSTMSMFTVFSFVHSSAPGAQDYPVELGYLATFDMVMICMYAAAFLGIYIFITCTYGDTRQTLHRHRHAEHAVNRRTYELEIIDAAIRALDIITFKNKMDIGDWAQENATCAICLADFEEDDQLCRLECNHVDHQTCVTKWLRMGIDHAHCPRCRKKVVELN